MKSKVHISDILNDNLKLIGSKLIFNYDSNEIGEEIAFKSSGNRFVEIIQMTHETSVWISFQDQGVFLGSIESQNIKKITKIIHSFLETKIGLKAFFNTEFGIESPIAISNLTTDEQILLELAWFNFLEPSKWDKKQPKEWLIIKEFAKHIKSFTISKGLIPGRSLNRLCFNSNHTNNLEKFPCLWVSVKQDNTREFTIGNYNGNSLYTGPEKEILIEFEKILKKLPLTS
jgi:hypothetical protein